MKTYREFLEELEKMNNEEFGNYMSDNWNNPENTDRGIYATIKGIPFEVKFGNRELIEYFGLEEEFEKLQEENNEDEMNGFLEDLGDRYHLDDDIIDEHFTAEKKDEVLEDLKYNLEYEVGCDLDDKIEEA